MQNHFFTIITATYNAADVLPRLLASLESQTCQDFVWVCQDGASTDDTLAIAKEWEGKIATSIASEKDTGIYDAWNKAIARQGDELGEWVLFLGADDLLAEDNVLEKVKYCCSQLPNDVLFVLGNIRFFSENEEPVRDIDVNVESSFASIHYKMIPHSALFSRRETLQKYSFNTAYRIVSDHDWLRKIWKNQEQLYKIPILITLMSIGGISSDASFEKLRISERFDVLSMHAARNTKEKLLFPYYAYILYKPLIIKKLKPFKDKFFITRKLWDIYKTIFKPQCK